MPATAGSSAAPAEDTLEPLTPPPEGAGRVAGIRNRTAAALVLAAAVAGLSMRACVLASPFGRVDSDEAVGGLVARHLVQGKLYPFLWGNVYGGTVEAFLGAPLLAVWPGSAVAWKAVMIVLFGAACVLTWRIGCRTVAPGPARLAAVLMWLWPAAFVLASTKARLYYGAALVLAATVLLLCLRLAERPSRRDAAALGLALGLGWWTAPFVGWP
jgi:hypothetical protein